MCLTIDAKITEKVRRKLKKGRVQFWVVKVRKGRRLHSAYQGTRWCRKPGAVKSSRLTIKLTKREEFLRVVNYGNHVYLTRRAAREKVAGWTHIHRTHVVVPVWGYKSHFVAAGRFERDESGVFRTLTITKEAFDKAVGRTP